MPLAAVVVPPGLSNGGPSSVTSSKSMKMPPSGLPSSSVTLPLMVPNRASSASIPETVWPAATVTGVASSKSTWSS